MKNKKIKVFVLITAIVVILCSVTATVLATAPSKNKNYKTSLEEAYAYLTGNYKKDSSDNELAKIVAYVNDVPIYYGEVVFSTELSKIEYNEFVLSGDKSENIAELLKKSVAQSTQEKIGKIARQRARIIEAEKQGFSVSDEAVKQKQAEEKKIKEDKIAAGDKVAIEIEKQYQELYKKLEVSEKEYYETYDFLLQKNYLTSRKLAEEYMKEYTKSITEVGEMPGTNVLDKYYDSLLEKVDFRLV